MGVQAALYNKGKELFASGQLDWDDGGSTFKATLFDNDYGVVVTNATNATPIVVSAASHGVNNGDRVLLIGVGGNANANGVFRAANVASGTLELTDEITGANIAGSGAYTSGGLLIKIATHDFYDDIPAGARLAEATLTSRTVTGEGALDAADVLFSSVTGTVYGLIIRKDTGVESTSPLVAILANMTGLPLVVSGLNVNVTFDNGNFRIART